MVDNEIEQSIPSADITDEDKIKEFRDMLEQYTLENGLKINQIKGWTDGKIEWMALNDNKCCCRPKDRICPCPEGLVEIKTESDHQCLCSILTRG